MNGREEKKKGRRLPPFYEKKNGVTTEDFMHIDHSCSSAGDFVSWSSFFTSASKSTIMSDLSRELLSEQTEWILYRGLSVQDLGTLPSQHGTFLPGQVGWSCQEYRAPCISRQTSDPRGWWLSNFKMDVRWGLHLCKSSDCANLEEPAI